MSVTPNQVINYNPATNTITTFTSSTMPASSYVGYNQPYQVCYGNLNKSKYLLGDEVELDLPNGAKFTLSKDGSYKVVDEGKVKYKGAPYREFNRYINASDLLEEFIRFMGASFDVKQSEILNIPLEMFITWLVIRSCQVDGDEIPKGTPRLEDHSFVKSAHLYRCRNCGRFLSSLSKQKHIEFCNSRCFDAYCSK